MNSEEVYTILTPHSGAAPLGMKAHAGQLPRAATQRGDEVSAPT
jgi:hypothetical protein